MNHQDLHQRFTYHPPSGTQPQRYEEIRKAAYLLAETFAQKCPESGELSFALVKLEEAVMWANKAIANNE
jgi:hypothetical protein